MRTRTVSLLVSLSLIVPGASTASAASSISLEKGTNDLGVEIYGYWNVTGDDGPNDLALGLDPSSPSHYILSDQSGVNDPVPTSCVRLRGDCDQVPDCRDQSTVLELLEGHVHRPGWG